MTTTKDREAWPHSRIFGGHVWNRTNTANAEEAWQFGRLLVVRYGGLNWAWYRLGEIRDSTNGRGFFQSFEKAAAAALADVEVP